MEPMEDTLKSGKETEKQASNSFSPEKYDYSNILEPARPILPLGLPNTLPQQKHRQTLKLKLNMKLKLKMKIERGIGGKTTAADI